MIIGICGFIGSGKDSIGNILIQQGFQRHSFGDSLKNVVSSIFGWDRALLEGNTEESRRWREAIDPLWSLKLGRAFSPRMALQEIGTNVMRNTFHQDIWVLSMEMKLKGDVVVTDCRFSNEIEMIRRKGGKIIHVFRDYPTWYSNYVKSGLSLETFVKDIHPSEWSWLSCPPDCVISNDGTLEQLETKVKGILKVWSEDKNERISKEDCSNQ